MSNFATIEIIPSAFTSPPLTGPNEDEKESIFSKGRRSIFIDPYSQEQKNNGDINFVTFEGSNFQKFFDLIWNYKNFSSSFLFGFQASGLSGQLSEVSINNFTGNFLYSDVSLQRVHNSNPSQINSEFNLTHYNYSGLSDIEVKIAAKVREINSLTNEIIPFIMDENNTPNLFPLPNFNLILSSSNSVFNFSFETGMGFDCTWADSNINCLVTNVSTTLIEFLFKSVFIDPSVPKVNLYFDFAASCNIGYIVPANKETPNGQSASNFNLNLSLMDFSSGIPMKFIYDASVWSGLSIDNAYLNISGVNPL